MSLKKVFTKMGLVEEDVVVKYQPQPTKTVVTKTETQPVVETPSYASKVDPDISEMLQSSLQENKLSGFDYLKFISAVEKMKSTGTPEDARFKMAFSAAESMGVTKISLLKTGDHYLDVLKQDEDDFNENCDQFDKKEVKSRENKLAQTEASITTLTKQLEQLNQDRESLKQELEDEKSKLETRKASFQTTLESFRSSIQANVEKINQYLQ